MNSSISLAATTASHKPFACSPVPITPNTFAFSRAKYFIATPDKAPVRIRVKKEPSSKANGSPVSISDYKTTP